MCQESRIQNRLSRTLAVTLAIATLTSVSWADDTNTVHDDMRRIREHIHANPELTGREYDTQAYLEKEFEALGLTVERMAGTGLKAVYDTGRPGPIIAFRAEMDALPIQETTGLEFASKRKGIAHACGHDMHMAILCGVASEVARSKTLGGQFVFLFQPAEEGIISSSIPSGAQRMVDEGALTNPEPQYIFALHVMDHIEVGQISLASGQAMAYSQPFRITIQGASGHPAAAGPDGNALYALSQVVSQHQASDLNAGMTTTSFGRMHAGTAYNVIPGEGTLEGSIRSYQEENLNASVADFEAHVARVCAENGVGLDIEYGHRYEAVNNDPELVALIQRELKVGDSFSWLPPQVIWAADDFSVYQKHVPGAYFFVGAVDSYLDFGPMHSGSFKPADRALDVGYDVFIALIEAMQTL